MAMREVVTWLAPVALALVAAAGCGGSPDDESSGSTTTSTAASERSDAGSGDFGTCILKVQPWALESIGAVPPPTTGVTAEQDLGAGTPELRIYREIASTYRQRAQAEGVEAVAGDVLRAVQSSCAAEHAADAAGG